MGRPPAPMNVKKLRGVDKKNPSRVNTSEPVPAAAQVEPPEWLAGEALAVWGQLAPDLEATGILTAWDAEAFACWCEAVARRRRAALALAEQGEIIDVPVFNKNGYQSGSRPARNPWALALSDADAQVQRYAARFGLTPSDRARLSVGSDDGAQGAERLLS